MGDSNTTVIKLKQKVSQFVSERDWQMFHSPKNLSMSVAIEAAELMELFQWVGSEESRQVSCPEQRAAIEDEIADVAMYLLGLCNCLQVDLSHAIERKLHLNEQRYPVSLCQGQAHKYTAYQPVAIRESKQKT